MENNIHSFAFVTSHTNSRGVNKRVDEKKTIKLNF